MEIIESILSIGRQASYEDELKFSIAYAGSLIKELGRIQAMVIGISRDKRHVCSFGCNNSEEKRIKATILKERFRKMGVSTIVYISEAWVKSVPIEEAHKFSGHVRDYPDKEEKVVIGYCDGITTKTLMLPIERDQGKVLLGEPSSLEDGSVVDFLWGDYFEP